MAVSNMLSINTSLYTLKVKNLLCREAMGWVWSGSQTRINWLTENGLSSQH